MNLFQLDDNFEVQLNREWIMLIPDFAYLVTRDKGKKHKGDYDGRRKLRAKRELAYVYLLEDPRSPIVNFEEKQKIEEAFRYTELEPKDIDVHVEKARETYKKLCEHASRALRTLKAVYKALDELDNYYNTVDFKATDKKGELLNDPNSFTKNIKELGNAYDAMEKFKERVYRDLKDSAGAQGNTELGFFEDGSRKKRVQFKEEDTELPVPPTPVQEPDTTSDDPEQIQVLDRSGNAGSFASMGGSLKNLIPKDEEEDAADVS